MEIAKACCCTIQLSLFAVESGTGKDSTCSLYFIAPAAPMRLLWAIKTVLRFLRILLAGDSFLVIEKGRIRGSFFSAGKFERRMAGTLLLDEITEMDVSFQAKITTVLPRARSLSVLVVKNLFR